ncbi:MAG TPA: trypsin-like peptidase domain-containing protein [Candidatus Acidoferrum sp.]|nr:trypsin-like peptidase domain-containing protein [Candidatus Acidoferrum sp.]
MIIPAGKEMALAASTENILLFAGDPAAQESLRALLATAGYSVRVAETQEELLSLLQESSTDLLLLALDSADSESSGTLAAIRGHNAASQVRVLLLTPGGKEALSRGLDLGADDAVAVPFDDAELLARVRGQLRQKRASDELAAKLRIAEESREVAQTAFQALAVTEKMTRDAFSLERILKIGVISLFSLALVVVAVFFLYSRRADKESRRAYTVIARLENNVKTEEQLLASARRLREDPANADLLQQKETLEQQAETLRKKMAQPDGSDVTEIRRQLDEATGRLSKIEGQSQAAASVIRSSAPSVCLLLVSVAFNEKDSGRRLRYGGIDSDGSPLKESDGNPVYTTEGRGPEVRADFFGTGFIVGEGKILTNHHVVQPWWQNDELAGAMQQGLQPVIAEMMAYFPAATNGIPVGISRISEEADLALIHGDLSELGRPALKLNPGKEAAVSGEGLISVGYATGLDAILARAGDETVEQIVKTSGGEPKLVLAELARRKLIRPLVTQGHVGDVLPDKIVYDAQTTSGGSGGPLLIRDGEVIGVTFAVVRGFGGSNFGVPIHYAVPLLKH